MAILLDMCLLVKASSQQESQFRSSFCAQPIVRSVRHTDDAGDRF